MVRSSGMTSTFFNYYMDDGCQLLNDTFSYMIIEGQLEWNVPYNRVTLEEDSRNIWSIKIRKM